MNISAAPCSSPSPAAFFGSDWGCQYLFDRPAKFNPVEDYMTTPALFFSPCRYALSPTIKSEERIAPSVSSVLLSRRPPYVPWLVVFIRVYAVKLKSLSWMFANGFAHVLSERSVVCPFCMHSDSTSTVIDVRIMGRAVAPPSRRNPARMERGSNFTVMDVYSSLFRHLCKEGSQL